MKFERIRLYDISEIDEKYHDYKKSHIEFVFLRTKYGDFLHSVFGNTLTVKHSKHFDDRFVYVPQNYHEFLMCLKETQINEDGSLEIDHVGAGALLAQPLLHANEHKYTTRKERKPFYLEDDVCVTVEELLAFAGEYLKDEYWSDEKAEKKKQKFLKDVTRILEELRESDTQSSI